MIAAVLRFYKGGISLSDIRNMTPEQLNIFAEQIGNVSDLEQGRVIPSKEMIAKVKQDAAIRKPNGTR